MNSILRSFCAKTPIYLAAGIFAAGLLVFSRETAQAASDGLGLCAQVIIPSLFPFFVVSTLFVQIGAASFIGRPLERPMRRLFNVPGACAPAFVLGLVGGYPVGAKAVLSLYEQGLCSKSEAEYLLAFCNNCGPAFVLSAVGTAMFKSSRAGVLLYVAHVLAAIVIGIVMRRPTGGTTTISQRSCRNSAEPASFSRAFTDAVTGSFASILNVCAFVVFFSVVIRLLTLTGLLSLPARLLGLLPFAPDAAHLEAILGGLVEMTNGIGNLAALHGGFTARMTSAALLMGWAGLSVHCQALSLILPSGLSPALYLKGKALHGAFAALLTWLGIRFFPFDAPVFGALPLPVYNLLPENIAASFWLSLTASLLCWVVLALLALAAEIKSRCQSPKKDV